MHPSTREEVISKMSEQQPSSGAPEEITENDKLMAALSYPIWIVALVILLSDSMRARPFQKYHAVQALAFNTVLWVVVTIVAVVTLGIGAVCAPLAWFVTFWPAYVAYQGEYQELPIITDFIRKQGWV
jgi:uncharacterized membrane protein